MEPLSLSTNPVQIIETPAALQEAVAQLEREPRIAVDTESNSLYAYQEQVCLIQISIPSINYLIDPLAVKDLSTLGPLFAGPNIEKIFHAADYDLVGLSRDYGFSCAALFDTMWAARILGWPHVGLADVLATHFNVRVNKRFQRYDWGQRPLDADALRYAWMDSHYLIKLRDIQYQELVAKERWEEAVEIFAYLSNAAAPHNNNHEDHFWRIKGVHDLNVPEQKILYQLYLWRETMAAKLNRPTVKIVSDNRLISLARIQPHHHEELYAAGLTSYQVQRFGSGLLKALHTKTQTLPSYPTQERPAQEMLERYNALKAWRKDVALGRGVDCDVILPNAALWDIARNRPTCPEDLLRVPGIGPWRQKTYGPAILTLLSTL
ncbi:MAG TPA: HRDC domain-containing protein [Anaerolineae bacterium]|nr:HRDC domain-containing protein [Anaerolineae bacterium]